MMINQNQLNIVVKSLQFLVILAICMFVPAFSAKAYITSLGSGPSTSSNYTTTSNSNGSYNSGTNYNNNNNNGNRPEVTTESARDINYTSALIQATSRVSSGSATVWFEYGTRTDTLTNTTRSQTLNVGTPGVSESITGLSSGTTYFYRVVARNENGVSFGAVKSFKTLTKKVVATTTTSKKSSTTSATTSTKTTTTSSDSVSGALSASAAAGNSGFLPSSIVGWLLILILVFAIVLVVRMIQRDMEEKKAQEAKMKMA